MARRLPMCEQEMLDIQHVTRANYLKYGSKLMEITTKYGAEKLGM